MSDAVRLRDLMSEDAIVRVYDSGEVSVQNYGGLWAPELYIPADDDGNFLPGWDGRLTGQALDQGWSLMRGYSGAHGQGRSVLMEPAEFIGGRMAAAILATPGVYVSTIPTVEGDPDTGVGWVVAYRYENESGNIPGMPDESRWRA